MRGNHSQYKLRNPFFAWVRGHLARIYQGFAGDSLRLPVDRQVQMSRRDINMSNRRWSAQRGTGGNSNQSPALQERNIFIIQLLQS